MTPEPNKFPIQVKQAACHCVQRRPATAARQMIDQIQMVGLQAAGG
jgi:hypothetical protein